MLSQSISQPCCLCGWQMTELDLSVIRWGKISFLSPSRSLTHALFLCCVWVAHSPRDVSPPVKSDSSVHRFLSLFPHPRISSFHDTRPCHFSSPCVITYPIILSLLGANLFFVRCWAHDERLPGIDLLHFYTHTQFHSISFLSWSLCQIRPLLSYLFLPCLGHETSQTTYWYPTFHGLLSRQGKHARDDFWEQQWKRQLCVWCWPSHIQRSLKKKEVTFSLFQSSSLDHRQHHWNLCSFQPKF